MKCLFQENCRSFLFITLYFIVSGSCLSHTIAYFYALEKDGVMFDHQVGPSTRSLTIAGTNIREYSYRGHRIILAKMGSGCVNTALSAQSVLATKKCDIIISTGPVGDISNALTIGDWYLVEKVIPWQNGSHIATGFKASDDSLRPINKNTSALTYQKISVASGEVFVNSTAFRDELHRQTSSQAVDMNLFGLVSAANRSQSPSLHLRIASDKAGDDAKNQFITFKKSYKGEGALIVLKWLDSLPVDSSSPESYSALKKILSDPAPEQKQQAQPTTEETDVPSN